MMCWQPKRRGKRRASARIIGSRQARDIQHHDWSCLTDRARIGKGLELLADCDWIAPQAVGKNPAGGRPTTFYTINPRARS